MSRCAPAITSDNSPFSLPTSALSAALDMATAPGCVQSIAHGSADHLVLQYLRAAISPATRKAYQSDLRDFLAWGGSIPCRPEEVARYLATKGSTLAPGTLARRVVAIGRAHTAQGHDNPARSDLVRAVLRGLHHTHGCAQRRAAPLLKRDMLEICAETVGLKGLRDRALLLLGFAAALRRAELVALDVHHLSFVPEGLVITVSRSKTDQAGKGRQIAVPFGRTTACPVKSVSAWLEAASISAGPAFRSVSKVGTVGLDRLSAQSVALIVKLHAKRLGLDGAAYSGHSLRAGLVTSAVQAGASLIKIQQQTGHKSHAVLARYIRDASLFENNAAGHVL